MNFHVLTLFPEMIENGMNTSITGRAITKGLLTLEAVNIRDYAFNKHQKVDDYTIRNIFTSSSLRVSLLER